MGTATDPSPSESVLHERELRASRWTPTQATLASLFVCGFVAMFVYGRAAGFVYSEDSDFALEFGHHSWYHALSFTEILGKYLTLGHGWYRPTGFYLIPYLLRIDYFQPAEQITLDIAVLVITATMITLFFRRLRVLTAVAASLSVLLAPALYQVTYGVQADGFYIIFGLAFLWVADRVFYGEDGGWRRAVWGAALLLTFLLTITTKEVGCLVALLMIPFLLLRGPDELTWARVRKVMRFALPFLGIVIAYIVIYKTQVNANSPTYSTAINPSRTLNFINLISWTLGFRSPRHTFLNWVPNWSHGETVVQALILAVVLGGLAFTWRRFRLWRIGLFLLTALITSSAIATVGGIPYHGYPLVIMYGFAFLAVMEAVADRLAALSPSRIRAGLLSGCATALVALIVLMTYQGHSTYGGVIYNGPQTPYLEASTELFDGSVLAPVRHTSDPLFIFQDCLGGLDNALGYYARVPTGTQITIPAGTAFSYPALAPQMQAAYARGRPVFAALCTGITDPWYVLRRYMGPKKGLVPAAS
jgi:hypothetical protein